MLLLWGKYIVIQIYKYYAATLKIIEGDIA